MAKEIVDACQQLGLDTVFEPGKMHPKDWANPMQSEGRAEEREGRGEEGKEQCECPTVIRLLCESTRL